MTEWVFWASLGLVAYVYGAFPLILLLRATVRRRPVASGAGLFRLSVLIAARNEADVIGRKLETILNSGYPNDLLEIVVVANGCTDRTAEVVHRFHDRGVKLIVLVAAGKAAALDAAVAASNGEVLVFMDANGELAPGALSALVRPFTAPSIGGVAGDQRYVSGPRPNAIGLGERRYWRWERFLKRTETRAGDVIAATGGLYAIRRELYEAIPPGATDDAFLSMGVVAKGFRLVFEPEAVVLESLTAGPSTEIRRKVRIVTRGLRTVWARRELLNPFCYGFYALQLWSHKLLRRLMPLPLIALVVTATLLADREPFYRYAAVVQLSFYAVGAAGLVFARTRVARFPIVSFVAYFVAANAAALVALAGLMSGRSVESWDSKRDVAGSSRPAHRDYELRAPQRRGERLLAVAVAVAIGVIAGIQPVAVLVLVAAAMVATVLAFRPDLALLTGLGLLYSNAIVLAIERHGVPAAAAASIPAVLLMPFVEAVIVRRQPVVLPAALPFIGAYAVAQTLSAAQAVDKGRAVSALAVFMLEGLGLYVVVVNGVRSRAMLFGCLRVLLVIGVLISVLVAVRAVTGDFSQEFGGFAQARVPAEVGTDPAELRDAIAERGGFLRQTGPLNGPGRFGQYWLPLVPIALLLALRARTRAGGLALRVGAVIVAGAIALTFTRGAFIGLVVSVAMLALLRVARVTTVVAALAVLVAFLTVVPSYRERLFSITAVSDVFAGDSSDADVSIEGRFTENVAALYMFRDHPLFGVGPANYAVNYRPYANFEPTNVRSGEREAHSLYLGLAAETGVLGLLAMLGVFLATLWELARARRRASDAEGRWIASASVAIVVGLMTTSMFLHFAFVRYFWMFMALAAVGARVAAAASGPPLEPLVVPPETSGALL